MSIPKIPKETAGLTVGSLRFLLQGMDDMAPISVIWESGHTPGDHAPAVRVFGFQKEREFLGDPYIAVRVGLVWPDDDTEEDE